MKRLQAKCAFKEVYRVVHPDAQAVSKFACHNSFNSHLVMIAGSNKNIVVWDVNAGKEIGRMMANHRKPLHGVSFYTGSDYVDALPESFNTFLTSGSDNFV